MIMDTYSRSLMKPKKKKKKKKKIASIFEWFNVFKNDLSQDYANRPSSGRLCTTSEKADEIWDTLKSDRRLTIRDMGVTGLA